MMVSDVRMFVGLPFELLYSEIPTIGIVVGVCVHLWTLFLVSRPMTLWRKGVFALIILAGLMIAVLPPVPRFFGLVPLFPDNFVETVTYCAIAIILTTILRVALRRFARLT
ncbi:MAG: hypothetical protein LBU67_09720 [Oscillospiraceae bacterium]|nr:hypothetical protein [Oscillospiraceae bacterium]